MNNLCTIFKGIDDILVVKSNNPDYYRHSFSSLNSYCPISSDGKNQECNNYEEITGSAFISLLIYLKNYVENDKLSQYAILWLCYELNKKNEISNLNEFYNKYIKAIEEYVKGSHAAEAYNSCMNIINKKQYLMSVDIKEMSKIYEALKFLCKLYTGCNDKEKNYSNYSQDANDFVKEFQKLNDDRSITENDSYSQILYTLFNDYNSFKNDCAKHCSKCIDIPTLPDINLPQNFVQDKVESSGVTSPSSSIAKTLIPALLIFAIPVFVGIAYKYSLFGIDKRLQRIHSRGKLRKIKEKINH
ncbi:CIR protein [Plasmodium chabaudi chabaudi]|uniref:CIR protein n=1 Tax=Plasmodium chabaudi chabaudi TaxID=31271 RepID=A0A077TKB1_PLACU|nr:CIR protein [Plasmodium chabaudi chabaudi]SCL84569.1 CIR protein [Plasmodium chabaudi chabaudi]SCL91951.1 CIR protein [Plasmodium chabaudi chabaudi]VTZ67886.1 CIR protein [Plasmodium chabaudi chabaudi]|eukprot:XP_016653514.1 CIR protein [Plasmodium chabaudi chabaudi]